MSIQETPRVSEKFNDTSADLVFESSDNVKFYLQERFWSCNAGYAISNLTSSQSDVIKLEESSATLELLFAFVSPQRQPSLKGVAWDLFILIAEAAEKYEVFAAINICVHTRMVDYLLEHAYSILQFAWLHDYEDLMNKAAKTTTNESVTNVFKAAQELKNIDLLGAWMIYIECHRCITNFGGHPTLNLPVEYRSQLLPRFYSIGFHSQRPPQKFTRVLSKVRGLSGNLFQKNE